MSDIYSEGCVKFYKNFIFHLKIIFSSELLHQLDGIDELLTDEPKVICSRISQFVNGLKMSEEFNDLFIKKKIKLFSHKNPITQQLSECLFGPKYPLKQLLNNQPDTVKELIWYQLHVLGLIGRLLPNENNENENNKNEINTELAQLLLNTNSNQYINPKIISDSITKLLTKLTNGKLDPNPEIDHDTKDGTNSKPKDGTNSKPEDGTNSKPKDVPNSKPNFILDSIFNENLNDATRDMLKDVIQTFEPMINNINNPNIYPQMIATAQSIMSKYSESINNGTIEMEKLFEIICKHIPGMEQMMGSLGGGLGAEPDITKIFSAVTNLFGSDNKPSLPPQKIIIDDNFSTSNVMVGQVEETTSTPNITIGSMLKVVDACGKILGGNTSEPEQNVISYPMITNGTSGSTTNGASEFTTNGASESTTNDKSESTAKLAQVFECNALDADLIKQKFGTESIKQTMDTLKMLGVNIQTLSLDEIKSLICKIQSFNILI
jgi:hypothetical protein